MSLLEVSALSNTPLSDLYDRFPTILIFVILSLGWSLGGCIALEMAHLLQEDVEIHVQGLVMVDSIYPKYRPDASELETYLLKFF